MRNALSLLTHTLALLSIGAGFAACNSNDTIVTGAQPAPATTTPPTQAPGVGPTVTVTIQAGATGTGTRAYGANPLTIQAGTTVTWVNQDEMGHTATSDGGIFDSGLLNSGQSFSFRFDSAGTFPYHCAVHGAASMSGTIVVQGGSGPAPTPTTAALTPTFHSVRDQILVPHCMSCHEGAAPSAGLDFTTWESLVRNPVDPMLVVPGHPEQSSLFIHIQGDVGGGGQEGLSASEAQNVSAWISAGAPNN